MMKTTEYNGWTNYETWVAMFADLLNAALSEVNWHEIAQHMIENVDKKESEPA